MGLRKLKKYIISILIVGVIIISSMMIVKTNVNTTETVDTTDVIQGYTNLLEKDGVEHLILKQKDGMTLDIYRDLSSGMERTDSYDENNILVERNITLDYGSSFLILSQATNEEGKWDHLLRKTLPPKDAVAENKELSKKSMIDGFIKEDFIDKINLNCEKTMLKDNLIKYTDKNNNFYINSKTGLVEKIEVVLGDEVKKSFYVEKLSLNEEETKNLFDMGASLLMNNSIMGNKSIEELRDELEILIDDNRNVEYDSNNARG